MFGKEPKAGIRFWTQIGDNKSLGFIEIEEFKGKDWQDCIIERPKEVETVKDSQEWLKKKQRSRLYQKFELL